MKLSDIMGQMNLSTLPQIAFVIFLGVFCAISWRLFRPSKAAREALDAAAQLPLEDGTKGVNR